ncbi:MAG: hypothetical protein EXR17_05545 [Flavobacteriaceae bacterium]|nr:hypothetical protein [Flavobacteriaceae bacterium]
MNINKNFLKQAVFFMCFVLSFWLLTRVFLAPPEDGMVLKQGDMQQVRLMRYAAELVKEKTGQLPNWNDRLFSGMPSGLITGVEQSSLLLKYKVIELFGLVKTPYNFLFVAMLSMFILLLSLKVDRLLAAAAAIGYAFMTFSISSYEAGHITKVLAMGAMPGVLAGLVLLSRKKYLLGAGVTALFFGMVVNYFHYQIAYYAGIMVGLYFIVEWIAAIKNKDFRHAGITTGIAVFSMGLAVLTCIGKLSDTNEYAKSTMRGGSAVESDNSQKGRQVAKNGLDIGYAFSWSYGVDETFTLLVPGFKGGSSGEYVNNEDFSETTLPLYFGDLQFTSGPVYMGATLIFLFILGMVVAFVWIREKPSDRFAKLNYWWAIFGLVTVVVSIILGLGRNFFMNEFLFNNLPYYNKFRTPMMALVIAQVVIPMIGLLGIHQFISLVYGDEISDKAKKNIFVYTAMIAAACIGLAIVCTVFSDFSAIETDKKIVEQGGKETLNKIKDLRSSLVWNDIYRSIMLMGVLLGLVYLVMKKQATTMASSASILVGVLIIFLVSFDMMGVANRYLNDNLLVETDGYKNWEDKNTEEAILPSSVDNQIIADNKDGKRVIDYRRGINGTFNDNSAGAFHHNVGGYHPAKMSRYQDVISYCIASNGSTGSGDLMNNHALDMLNCGYILGISQDEKSEIVAPRYSAMGAAWFVDSVCESPTAKQALLDINTKNLHRNVIVESDMNKKISSKLFLTDSSSRIVRIFYSNDSIRYQSKNLGKGLAVFSEIYYNEKNGFWRVYIDGKEAKSLRVNYILRGVEIPAGNHAISWVYKPADRSGYLIMEWASSAIILLLMAGSLCASAFKKEDDLKENGDGSKTIATLLGIG